ncbi:hypothetical protein CSB37_01555 [bacterium DOLZORAL124_38_8]|nr:MAG: hypothetical protein CSB37_01555 [bacterium DOLZORAL124_38_8]
MTSVKIPQNVLVLATHGSACVPAEAQKHLHDSFSPRLQRNFSDFATKALLKNFPKRQIACPKYGRIVGDPNRSIHDSDLFRAVDFNNIQIWKKPLSRKQKKKYLIASRQSYLDSIFAKIEYLCQITSPKEPLILLDLHDTGNRMLGETHAVDVSRAEFTMPKVIFSNQNHKTTESAFLRKAMKVFQTVFEVDDTEAKLNEVFYGGFITKFFGGVESNQMLDTLLQKYNRKRDSLLVFQCELNRDLYLDEAQQKIRPEMGRIRRKFEQFVSQLAR